MRMEPLATVGQLERYLLKLVAKQWYDNDRSTFTYIKKIKEQTEKLVFTYRYDFDENGIIYWIGTNAKYVYNSCVCFLFIYLLIFFTSLIQTKPTSVQVTVVFKKYK